MELKLKLFYRINSFINLRHKLLTINFILAYKIIKLSTKNIYKKIDSLLNELQVITGISDEELEEFKNILELTHFSDENN
tara:strand:- start:204 stop:443 length:240 start_codon:yes stop_codon:yes gene_type:complete